MEEVKTLGYQDKPPYERLRAILQGGLKSIQSKDDGRLEFSAASGPSSSRVQVGSHADSKSWSLDYGPRTLVPGIWTLIPVPSIFVPGALTLAPGHWVAGP